MNKLGLVLTLSLGLVLSPLCAVESTYKKNVQNTSLSQADKEFLFASNANHLNVVALSDEEMQKTEGEAIDPITGAFIIGFAGGAGYEAGKQVVKKIKKWFRW
ncbi:hypothetical protein [Helicobacter hepaticus]|jgi:hypothetical protein|uniref:Uncharacterized protein n=1 Tax=Helicobacter hepaticus (strain ATCC 51449 / 3B1) TaxID=235279 RepID=Q7VJQ3_HELHP|nr:hypothetical protein [Helicobacter hepaticus]AAP76787.1 hypothetical protein HH_0190 [Helicobacter hepaticus ATCC 51449]